MLRELLPRCLTRLTLLRWSLHDQAQQLAAIAQACGPTLAYLELRDPRGIQDLPALMACRTAPAGNGAGGSTSTALRQLAVTVSCRGCGATLPAPWRCIESEGAGGAPQRSVRTCRGLLGLCPLLERATQPCACCWLTCGGRVAAGDGSEEHDPLLRPAAYFHDLQGQLVAVTDTWAQRTGRAWGGWHQRSGLHESPGNASRATAAAYEPAGPDVIPAAQQQHLAVAEEDEGQRQRPAPRLRSLVLQGLELRGGDGLVEGLMLVAGQLTSLELLWPRVAQWDRGEAAPEQCAATLLAEALPCMRALRRLRVVWGEPDLWVDPARCCSERASSAIVGGLLALQQRWSCGREEEEAGDAGVGSSCDGGDSSGGVVVLELVGFDMAQRDWRRLTAGCRSITHLQVGRVLGYNGSLPQQLVGLVMEEVDLAHSGVDACLQTWQDARCLERVDIGFLLDANPYHYWNVTAKEPPPGSDADAQLVRLRGYCATLARVPAVSVRLAANQAFAPRTPHHARPSWPKILEPLGQVSERLRSLVLCPLRAALFSGRHLEAAAAAHKGLEVLGLERVGEGACGCSSRSRGGGGPFAYAFLPKEARDGPLRLTDGELMRAALALPHLRALAVDVRRAGGGSSRWWGGVSAGGVQRAAAAYSRRYGRDLLVAYGGAQ